ncbi:MAG: hypothetical protein UZ22_OP11002000108, partial [Microgenomates bacterium OLB23]
LHKKNEKSTEESAVLIEPELYNIPDATSSASLVIEGRATDKTVIEVYINEDKAEETIADDGEFSLNITLAPGENSLYIRSFDEKKS